MATEDSNFPELTMASGLSQVVMEVQVILMAFATRGGCIGLRSKIAASFSESVPAQTSWYGGHVLSVCGHTS